MSRTSRILLLPDFGGLPRPFWVLFAGTLVNRVGGFVLVFLAIYLTEVRGLTPAEAGSVISVYGLGAIGGAPLGGALSDRFGRRPALVVSLVGGGASMWVLGFVTRIPLMVVTATVTGLLYEMYRPVVSATIADIVASDDRPRAYGLLYWAVNLGASVAPLLGAYLAATSYQILFIADGATAMLCGLMLWVGLPETQPARGVRDGDRARRVILGDRLFLTVCLLTFWLHVVFFQAFIGLPVDMRAHGISTAMFGALMALNPVLIVLLQPWGGELIRGRSRVSVLALASLLIGAGFGMNALAGSALAYAGTIVLFTLGEILFAPASISLVADLAPPQLRGRYQGTFAVAFTAAFAAAPLVGGYLMTIAGAAWLWTACLATGLGVSEGFFLLRGAAARAALAGPTNGARAPQVRLKPDTTYS